MLTRTILLQVAKTASLSACLKNQVLAFVMGHTGLEEE